MNDTHPLQPVQADGPLERTLALWEWRRRIADLYAEVRTQEPEAAWAQWRRVRDELFASHPQSPIPQARRGDFTGLPFFDYDADLRLSAALVPVEETWTVDMDVGRDGTVVLTPFARTDGLAGPLGAELTLYWIGGYGGGVFLPFRDATSGPETFAGGRYLLDTIKGADLGRSPAGNVVLDFNFAYNPSCAYSQDWVCPLAPPGNRFPAAIRAGERTPV